MPRKMKIHLTPGSIGVKANQQETAEFAHDYGFEAVEPFADQLSKMSESGIENLKGFLNSRNLVFGCATLPVNFRASDEEFRAGTKILPEQAKALQRAGVTRVGTWLRPTHDKLTYRQNFDLHVKRLSEVADLLQNFHLRLGMEYVGPKTSWSRNSFPFVHTMVEMKELIAAMGKKNVGVVLDSWHWYTSKETKDDLLALKNEDIVSCDLNDAPAGINVDQQIDNARELPCATGVINVAEFLGALQTIGYDGPVRAEPFNAVLNKMPQEEILTVTVDAMRKAFALIGG